MRWSNGKEQPSVHAQVETGFGFTCDEEILDIVTAFENSIFVIGNSCQSTEQFTPARRWVKLESSNENFARLEMAMATLEDNVLRDSETKWVYGKGWHIGPDKSGSDVRWITWEPKFDSMILTIAKSFTKP